MRTLLALVAATAMIAAALYVRGGGSEDGGIIPGPSSEPASLVCVPELATVCEDLAGDDVTVTIEEAGETTEKLSTTDQIEHDAWLTLAPWPQIAADARKRAGSPQLPAAGTPLARSPLVMVVASDRAPVLDEECGGTLTWKCVGRVAGLPWSDIGGEAAWGQVKPGFPDPSASASGLLVVGQAAGDQIGRNDFAARDLDTDEFLAWSSQLERGVPTHGSGENTPLDRQVSMGPAAFDVVGATEAEAGPLLAGSERAKGLALRYPDSSTVAEAVLAPLRGTAGADRLADLLRESGGAALAQAGWRVAGEQTAAGVATELPLPDESNLPSAGVLDALRARWGEIAR